MRGHRELFALSHRPQAGRAAADVVRVCAGQRAGVRRREPRHGAAARRHVSRRLPAQGDAGRIRLPPALVHGQSAAALRGMGHDAAADHVRLGHAQPLGDGPDAGRVRRAGDPPDRPDRSGGGGAAGAHAGRRSRGRSAAGRREGIPRAGHRADQAHGGRPDRISARAGNSRALHALRHRHHRAHRDHSRSYGLARSTCWSASICCAKASTFRNARWSPFSMPTRKASCAARRRWCRPSGGRRATSRAAWCSTPTR